VCVCVCVYTLELFISHCSFASITMGIRELIFHVDVLLLIMFRLKRYFKRYKIGNLVNGLDCYGDIVVCFESETDSWEVFALHVAYIRPIERVVSFLQFRNELDGTIERPSPSNLMIPDVEANSVKQFETILLTNWKYQKDDDEPITDIIPAHQLPIALNFGLQPDMIASRSSNSSTQAKALSIFGFPDSEALNSLVKSELYSLLTDASDFGYFFPSISTWMCHAGSSPLWLDNTDVDNVFTTTAFELETFRKENSGVKFKV
jgi:hypothetical protein